MHLDEIRKLLRQAVDRANPAMRGVVDDPEHMVCVPVRCDDHHLRDEAIERGDAGGRAPQ